MFILGDVVMTHPMQGISYVGFVVSLDPVDEGTVTCRFWYSKEATKAPMGRMSGHGSMNTSRLIKIGSLSDFGIRIWELPYAEW